jgi:hypothetical protein
MLRYVTSTLTACALAGTVSVFAQQPAPAQPPPAQPATPPAETQATKETLTGCVMAAKTTTGETAYVLNNVEGKSASMYVLAESPQSGLSPASWSSNVSKKVEVTGPVQKPPSGPAGEDAGAANAKVVRPPLVQAESVKVVGDTCK